VSCLEEVPGHITPEICDRMEEIETIRDFEIATRGDVKNANEILQAYQEGALSIKPGKVTYWFNRKQKTSFVNSLSIPFEEIIEWQRQEGEGKLWIEDVSVLHTYLLFKF
jgi:hypothetical protein